jgi:hypothetical protein
MQSIIHVSHRDIALIGPRSGCGFQSVHREVKEITEIEGGLRGVIRYGGKEIYVYQRAGNSGADIWTTNTKCLGPVKVTRVYGGSN